MAETAKKTAAPKAKSYVVAEGKAITAKGARVLGPGQPVTEADFVGGSKVLKGLETKGYIVSR